LRGRTDLRRTAPAQRRPAGSPPQEAKVNATITLNVAGAAYHFSGQAVCEHLSQGSIYDIRPRAGQCVTTRRLAI
jgi:hypothetical protein